MDVVISYGHTRTIHRLARPVQIVGSCDYTQVEKSLTSETILCKLHTEPLYSPEQAISMHSLSSSKHILDAIPPLLASMKPKSLARK